MTKEKRDAVVAALLNDVSFTMAALYSYDDFIRRIVPETVKDGILSIVR